MYKYIQYLQLSWHWFYNTKEQFSKDSSTQKPDSLKLGLSTSSAHLARALDHICIRVENCPSQTWWFCVEGHWKCTWRSREKFVGVDLGGSLTQHFSPAALFLIVSLGVKLDKCLFTEGFSQMHCACLAWCSSETVADTTFRCILEMSEGGSRRVINSRDRLYEGDPFFKVRILLCKDNFPAFRPIRENKVHLEESAVWSSFLNRSQNISLGSSTPPGYPFISARRKIFNSKRL